MSQKLAIPAIAATTMWAALASAQDASSCSAFDLPCIEDAFVRACRLDDSTHDTCMDWLRELERSQIAGTPNARLTSVSAYAALAETSDSPEDAARFEAEALQILQHLVAENPANVQALLGLAARAATLDERVVILKQIVEVDPSYAFGWEALADAVDESERPEDLVESAQYLENAYNVSADEKKWRIAANAVLRYRRAASIVRANDFVELVRRDFELDRKMARFRDVTVVPPTLRSETLRSVCSEYAITIFGGENCVRAVDAVGRFVKEAPDTSLALAAAEDLADTMVRAAGSGWMIEEAVPDWHARFLDWMNEIIKSGKVSGPIYVAQARLASNKVQRLLAMQEAARSAPLDGEIALGLGLLYLDLQRWQEAAAELMRARDLLPEERHELIDTFLDQTLDEP